MTSGVDDAVRVLLSPIVVAFRSLGSLIRGRARHPYAPAGPSRAMRFALSAQATALGVSLLYDPKLNPSLGRVPDELGLPPDAALVLVVGATLVVLMLSLVSQTLGGLGAVVIGFFQVSLTTGTLGATGMFLVGTLLLYLLTTLMERHRMILAFLTMLLIFALVEGYFPTRMLD